MTLSDSCAGGEQVATEKRISPTKQAAQRGAGEARQRSETAARGASGRRESTAAESAVCLTASWSVIAFKVAVVVGGWGVGGQTSSSASAGGRRRREGEVCSGVLKVHKECEDPSLCARLGKVRAVVAEEV